MPAIRSLSAIRQRLLLGVLKAKGIGVHRVAEAARIAMPQFVRLMEFGAPLDRDDAARLYRVAEALMKETRPVKPSSGMKLGDWRAARPSLSSGRPMSPITLPRV